MQARATNVVVPSEAPAAAATGPGATTAPEVDTLRQLDLRLAELISERRDLADNSARDVFLSEVRELQRRRDVLVRERASRLGLPMEGDRPGGGRFALVGFEGDRPIYDRTENVNAAISTAANLVRQAAPYSVDGAGIVIGLWEAGGSPLATHQEFGAPSRVTIVDATASSSHATHVAGTLIAAGLNAAVKGMAPSAAVRAYSSSGDIAEMLAIGGVSEADAGAVNISNHSYGRDHGWETETGNVHIWYGTFTDDGNRTNDIDQRFGRYTSDSANIDAMLCNVPYLLPFFSAGNHRNDNAPATGAIWYQGSSTGTQRVYDPNSHPVGDGVYKGGYDTLEGKKVAKNVLVVGAVLDAVSGGVRALGPASPASFSCFGPTDDGRIKPDVVANGNTLTSTTNASATATGSSSGTSMSAPNASGSAALLAHYHATRFPGASMRASTLKGLIIHTADDLGVAGPDYANGWGLMNTQAAAGLIKDHADANGRGSLIEGALTEAVPVQTYSFFHDGSGPLRATLCWTDPAGTVSSAHDDRAAKLVHDLDLSIATPASGTLLPFVMPHVGAWTTGSFTAAATYGVNHVDNVEQVYRASAVAGIYIVSVSRSGALRAGGQVWSLVTSGHAAGPLTSLQLWRHGYWGTHASTGTTGDHADPDQDGLVNLIEYAFGLNPTTSTPATQIPAFVRQGETVSLNFTTPPGVSGVVYAVQTSTDLAVWDLLEDQGSGPDHSFVLSLAGKPKIFFRILVTVP